MKIPLRPPTVAELTQKLSYSQQQTDILKKISLYTSIGQRKEYLHWDKLRHLEPPKAWSTEELWLAIKLARSNAYKPLPFTDKRHQSFQFTTPDSVVHKLYTIDRYLGRAARDTASVLNTGWRQTYLISSIIEEAINSSQLEGAVTTRKVAKAMLRAQRKPSNPSEQMIVNNYRAMQFVQEIKHENLSAEIIFELHRILTEKTLARTQCGVLRTDNDNIHVWDDRDHTILHTPPNASELKLRLRKICNFANTSEDEYFIHPVSKAIILHFMLAYDHPFIDGNGRTARALFYWYLLKNDYHLVEFISISRIIKNAPAQYAKAFLYTETDDNDMTYFIIHQLETIVKALQRLNDYLRKQTWEIKETERLVYSVENLRHQLNYRQIALIKHALTHPNDHYSITAHRVSHDVTYDTARNDLLKLAKLKLFVQEKKGKAFMFLAASDLQQRLENRGG
ncbi:MAG: Fic family protein [Pseudomonadota bacterium]